MQVAALQIKWPNRGDEKIYTFKYGTDELLPRIIKLVILRPCEDRSIAII